MSEKLSNYVWIT